MGTFPSVLEKVSNAVRQGTGRGCTRCRTPDASRISITLAAASSSRIHEMGYTGESVREQKPHGSRKTYRRGIGETAELGSRPDDDRQPIRCVPASTMTTSQLTNANRDALQRSAFRGNLQHALDDPLRFGIALSDDEVEV